MKCRACGNIIFTGHRMNLPDGTMTCRCDLRKQRDTANRLLRELVGSTGGTYKANVGPGYLTALAAAEKYLEKHK